MLSFKKIAAIAMILGLTACAYNNGTKVDETKLATLQRGKTTFAQAVQTLGEPDGVTTNADGTKTAMYMYSSSKVHAASYIPLAGALVGGADTKTGTTILQFNKNGILTDYSNSTSGSNSTRE